MAGLDDIAEATEDRNEPTQPPMFIAPLIPMATVVLVSPLLFLKIDPAKPLVPESD